MQSMIPIYLPISTGNAHEKDVSTTKWEQRSFGENMEAADRLIDLMNNMIGREIEKNNPNATNSEIVEKVLKEFTTNGLWTATKDKDGPFNSFSKVFDIHSHPGDPDEIGASRGDIKFINKKNQNASKYTNGFPKHYVYNVIQQTIYYYTPKSKVKRTYNPIHWNPMYFNILTDEDTKIPFSISYTHSYMLWL